ncbi:MAG TPA: hypothetical protein VH370_21295 [Humisphaera sp.]|jgi:hypothetical protein|nr:hypothetical protein [Humisphaera sp.]
MNPIARAICVAALLVSVARICAADGSAHAKLLINYPGVIRCYEDGRVEFQDWTPDPGPMRFLGARKVVVSSTAQLSPLQLSLIIAAVDEYLIHPAPFLHGNLSITDQPYTLIDVRHGQKIRLTCIRHAPDPPALEDFLQTIREPLASAKLESGDPKRRDEILAEFKTTDPALARPFFGRPRDLVSIPNDDPDKLVEQLFQTTALGRGKSNLNQCLIFLAALEGTSLGDTIYASIQKHREGLSVGDQVQLLETALYGGSLKAFPEFPKLLHNSMVAGGDVATFPDALDKTLEEHFEAEDLPNLAKRIGVDQITPARSLKAWDWLAANLNQLKFDQWTHRFHIVDAR